MNKFFKLSAVSMLAIMATANANAAGYTCEELIEYTSCNPGYTMKPLCPIGYAYQGVGCWGDHYVDDSYNNKTECEDAGREWSDIGWCATYYDNGESESNIHALLSGTTCAKCPVGYLCSGGELAAVACPAGSYCADEGASVATGKCNIGTYSTGGATSASCTSCPATGLTDKNGAAVVATTLSTGSTSASACFVGNNVEFKDDKGIWHYKSECKHGNYGVGACVEAHYTGNVYECDYFGELVEESGLCCDMPTSEAECLSIEEGNNSLSWDGYKCECSGSWQMDESGQLYCEGM